jgi:hypothetical protein
VATLLGSFQSIDRIIDYPNFVAPFAGTSSPGIFPLHEIMNTWRGEENPSALATVNRLWERGLTGALEN